MSIAKDIVQCFTIYTTLIYYVVGTHQLCLLIVQFVQFM